MQGPLLLCNFFCKPPMIFIYIIHMLEIWFKSPYSWPIIDFPTWMLRVFLNLPVSVRQLKYPRVQTLRIFEGVNTVYRISGIPTFLPFS